MSKKQRSAKGEQVDFDLLRLKEQISASPAPLDVKARRDFIEQRSRRRVKKVPPPAPKVELNKDPKLPGTENLSEEPVMIDEVVTETTETTETPKTTRQKARPSKKSD